LRIIKVSVNRKFNLGNYETLDMSAEAELSENDKPLEIWEILRDNIEMEFSAMQRKDRKAPTPASDQATKPQPTTKAPEQTKGLDAIRMKFSEDVETRLTFEQKGNYVIVKPKQFLGSELFAAISGIIRGSGGEYISAGKDSHWRVPV
jgi:hypothetical protein